MDASDLPMVFFTVVSQMSVGTFLVLGVLQIAGRRKHSAATVERLVAPVLYAIGPALVLGLIVSMFHMHDVTHSFNVIRHWQSSWLSREIIFGCAFALFGFVFAILEWFESGALALRQTLAVIAALLGIGLLVSESMIYYSLVAIPAWHSWAVPFQFCATAILLGAIGVAGALMVATFVRLRPAKAPADQSEAEAVAAESAAAATSGSETGVAEATGAEAAAESDAAESGAAAESPVRSGLGAKIKERFAAINSPTSDEEWQLTAATIRGTAIAGALIAIAILVSYPIYVGGLSQGNAAAIAAAHEFSGGAFWSRLILVGVTAILLGFFVFTMAARTTVVKAKALVYLVLATFIIAIVGEFLGRWLHYAAMIKAGL